MKFIKSIFMLLVLAAIVLGLQAMSYESDIFYVQEAIWCIDGGCETRECSTTASLVVKSACNELGANCFTCVDYTLSSCLCTTGSDFCIDGHTYYYGNYVECDIDK